MAKVPTFEGGQRRAPLHQSNFTVRARPEAFGAAAGRGLLALGQGVGDVGEAITTVADLSAQNALKNAQADYMEGARALASDPDTGFLSRTGSAALGGRAGVEQLLNELGQRTAETLPRRVHAQFRDFRTRHDTSILGEYLKHESEQTKVQTRAASQRRVSTLRQEAVRNHTDPVAHLESLQEAEVEFRTMAGWNGLSGEATEQVLAQHRDNVQSDIILQKAEANPLAAEVYYNNVKDSLQEQTRRHVEHLLGPAVKIARADAKAEEVVTGLGVGNRTDPVHGIADIFVEGVEKNANLVTGSSGDNSLIGSAGEDPLATPSSTQSQEQKQGLERVRQIARQKSEISAVQLTRSGVMLSPGNLAFAQALGTPLAIAFNQADTSASAAPLLADAMRLPPDADLRAEIESELGGITAGDLVSEFSHGTAPHFGGVDIEASLAAQIDPEERSLSRNQITIALIMQNKQRSEAANARFEQVYNFLDEGRRFADLPLDVVSDLQPLEKEIASNYAKTLAAGGQRKTDLPLTDVFTKHFEKDPGTFSALNLFNYKDQIGQKAFQRLRAWQVLAQNDEDGAEETADQIAFLRSFTKEHLRNAGFGPGNLDENQKRDAFRFHSRLVQAAVDFHDSEGRWPKKEEIAELAEQQQAFLPKQSQRYGRIWQSAYEAGLESFDGNEEMAESWADLKRRELASELPIAQAYRAQTDEYHRWFRGAPQHPGTRTPEEVASDIRYGDALKAERAAQPTNALVVDGWNELFGERSFENYWGEDTAQYLGDVGEDITDLQIAIASVFPDFLSENLKSGLESYASLGPTLDGWSMAAQSAPSLPTYVAAGGLKLGVIGTKMAGLMALGLRYAPRGKRTDLHYTEVMDRIRTAEVGLKHARSRGNTKKINELNRDLYDERLNELNMIVPQKGYRRPASPHWVPSKKDFSELHDTIESAKKTWIAQSDQFLRKLEKRGTHILGQESGATFRNLENSLEKNDIHSKLGAKKGTKYYEYYVFHERPVPNLQYVNAGWTRLIIGSDERVYITFDHYNSFTEVRKMQPGFFESLRVNN